MKALLPQELSRNNF